MSLEIQVSKKKSSNKIKGSDAIALFLKRKKIKHAFGIIGSANSHIFDSVNKLKYTKIVDYIMSEISVKSKIIKFNSFESILDFISLQNRYYDTNV